MSIGKLVVIKDGSPFSAEQENPTLLNPLVRAVEDGKGSYTMPKKFPTSLPAPKSTNADIAHKLITAATDAVHGVGTDVELISALPLSESFISRNFTEGEIAYCQAAADPRASFAARWSSKEAVFKSLKTESKGAGASLKDVEVVATPTGPQVELHGEVKAIADKAGIKSFELSMSHSDDTAVAVVIARS